jgi:predicted MFS family arabinose efflux permease
MTGIGIGMAIGSAASGWVIDQFGASNGFWVSIVAGATALATALLGNCRLRLPTRTAAAMPMAA